ncbi:hypothetical protein [Bordetella sp. BOR01]|uniref:hypothetical protein n=1 Tax=Bordetella sp. BOR01 TaxID=2854779 RepID=UPI001C44BE99|nr:hypothetical protein [Bordetella sp. BOR01]MBV7481827.1 hypothetical protein [Bordetella sp. BOR01]
MSIQTLGRCSVALCLVALAGCSSGGSGTMSRLFNECTWNRSGCMHEGSYEADEEDYAEEEAARLNKAQSVRFRRGSGD